MIRLFFYSIFFYSITLASSNVIGQEDILSAMAEIKMLESDSVKILKYSNLQIQLKKEKFSKIEGSLFHELGLSHFALSNNNQAIDFLLKAIEVRKGLISTNLEQLNESRYALSQVYKELLRIDEQNQLLNSIIREGLKDKITCRAYADIGRNIAVKGDYDSALQYLNTVLADPALMQEIDHELIIRLKITFVYGQKYQYVFKAEKGSPDFEDFKRHQIEIEKKLSKSSLDQKMYFGFLNNLAVVSQSFGEVSTALDSYNKSLVYYKKKNDAYFVNLILSNIGTVYSKLGDHEKANWYYQEVIEKAEDIDLIAAAYINKGYFSDIDSTKEKIPYYYTAFDILLDRELSNRKSFILPSLKEIRESAYELDFLTYLIDLASIFVQSHKESNNVSNLESAKDAISLIDQLVSHIRYESLSEASKLYWIEKGVDTYMLGVEVCYLLNQMDDAFYFMEKNKALLLQENIKTLQRKWQLDIPSITLEREYALYYERIDLYEQLLQSPNDDRIKEKYTSKNRAYTSFMDSIDMRFPDYTKTKEQVQITTLDEAIQKYVSHDKCVIEYILNDNDGFGIFCSSTDSILFKIPNVQELQSDLLNLEDYWTAPILNKTQTAEFKKIATRVFNKLFPFPNAFDKLSGKLVTIISDQRLHHVPFEALTVGDDLDLIDSYLINFCEISYLQSISLSDQIQQKENSPANTFLGVVPYEFPYSNLPTLTKSTESVEEWSKFQLSKILIGSEATKTNFLNEIDDYSIIHLNTHAGVDSFNLEPWIAFRDAKMGLSELYGIENQAELVVLDACKANNGKLALGEGILSLSRGFFYNGTQSVLASIWNVNEQSGIEIINSFYDKLHDGKTKSKALQLAKIDYLQKQQYSKILPYYWAAFTLTGDISPVELRRSNNLLVYLGMTLLGLVLFFFYRSRYSMAKQ